MDSQARPAAPPIEVQGRPELPLGMSPADFLRDYWQKHPLLIRAALANTLPALDPDELAGLACEEAALSRIVIHAPAEDRWQLRTGPFQAQDFAELPVDHWTLLVQDVDKWDTDVARLLTTFRFLPNWRVDDVMVSYAEAGGGVGAHVDQYDVFLLQGQGIREWAISVEPAAPKRLRPDLELKLLAQFDPTHRWQLAAGDMLYLPPGVPHDGVAVGGSCVTYSIGMRAPSRAELCGDLADYLAERLPDELRYNDPDLTPATRPGEIDAAALRRLRHELPFAANLNEAWLLDWFGRFITRYRSAQTPVPSTDDVSAAAVQAHLNTGGKLLRHPWTRLAWGALSTGPAQLFASGQAYACPADFALSLCTDGPLRWSEPLTAKTLALLAQLVEDGHFVLL